MSEVPLYTARQDFFAKVTPLKTSNFRIKAAHGGGVQSDYTTLQCFSNWTNTKSFGYQCNTIQGFLEISDTRRPKVYRSTSLMRRCPPS